MPGALAWQQRALWDWGLDLLHWSAHAQLAQPQPDGDHVLPGWAPLHLRSEPGRWQTRTLLQKAPLNFTLPFCVASPRSVHPPGVAALHSLLLSQHWTA